MKKLFAVLVLVVSLLPLASAQKYVPGPGEHSASTDITITGTYKIKEDQMTVTLTAVNNSSTISYQQVVYTINCIDQDGKIVQSAKYTLNDPIAHGASETVKKATYTCPETTKTLSFAIFDGAKMDEKKK
jgi:hypothetical protein